MPNTYFQFKQFTIHHDHCAMKVTTDSCLFGAWCAKEVQGLKVQNLKLLDVGAGSGLLSLIMAQKNNVEIDAIEINKEAAEQAKENVAASPWKDIIKIINEDVLQWKTGKKYDIIVSNPPFYEGSLKSGKLEKDTAHHSTQLTLQQLIKFIKNHLSANGIFFLLLPFVRLQAFQIIAEEFDLNINEMIHVQQTSNHSPFRVMVHGSLHPRDKTILEGLSIKNHRQEYTTAFVSLVRDYYLHM